MKHGMGNLLVGLGCQALPALPLQRVEHPVGVSWEYPKIRRHKAEEEEAEAKRFGKLEMLRIPKGSGKRKQEVCTVQMKEVAAALTFISVFQVCFSRRIWEISLSKCPDSKGVMGMETRNAGDQDTVMGIKTRRHLKQK